MAEHATLKAVHDLVVEMQDMIKGHDLRIVVGATMGVFVTALTTLHGPDTPAKFDREVADVLRSLIRADLNQQQ